MTVAIDYFTHMCVCVWCVCVCAHVCVCVCCVCVCVVCVCVCTCEGKRCPRFSGSDTAFKWQLERQGMLIKATPVLGVWGQLAMVAGLLAVSFGCLSAVIGK